MNGHFFLGESGGIGVEGNGGNVFRVTMFITMYVDLFFKSLFLFLSCCLAATFVCHVDLVVKTVLVVCV